MIKVSIQEISTTALPDYSLYFLLVLEVNLFPVLRPHQHGCVAEGGVPQVGAVTLYHCGGQDGHHICTKAGGNLQLFQHTVGKDFHISTTVIVIDSCNFNFGVLSLHQL